MGCILFTCGEGEGPFSLDLKSLGVRGLGTFRLEDTMLIIMTYQEELRTTRLLWGRASRSVVWFLGGSRVPCGVVRYPEGSPSDGWPHLLPRQEWWGPP
jgi:hypothetical protein